MEAPNTGLEQEVAAKTGLGGGIGCVNHLLCAVVGLCLGIGNLLTYWPLPVGIFHDLSMKTLQAEWEKGSLPAVVYTSVGAFVLNAVGVLLVPCLALASYKLRNSEGLTWYEKYCDVPAQRMGVILFYACSWGFMGHCLRFVVEWECEICDGVIGKYDWNPSFPTAKQLYSVMWWLHIIPAGFIAMLGPLQFTVKVRKWNNFQAHRWIGRFLLSWSIVHQASASYIVVVNLFLNRNVLFPTSWWASLVYALGFVPINIISWAAIIMGWRCARQQRIVEHAAWMYRLGSMWVMTIMTFRMNVLFFTTVFGPEWGAAIQIPCAGLIAIPTEIYIRYSGRFDWSKVGKSVPAREVADDLRCPFLGIAESAEHCPFSSSQPASSA